MTLSVVVCLEGHSWSIEDWIHSKRRNRIGQDLVERLVHTYTNLKLEQSESESESEKESD
jgi:hypothetical protein